MPMLKSLFALLYLVLSVALMPLAQAANPDEILKDPALEERAREISAKVRCLVCQNQSIDDSEAEVARDLRVLIREKLTDGASNQEIYDFLASKYGEFILFQPRLKFSTLLLWGLPFVALLMGLILIVLKLRKNPQKQQETLTKEEQEALDKLLS